MTSKVTYTGGLRTVSVHIRSGNEIISDAPVDNHGKGEAFSPTDTVANALATCMFTVMGIKAASMDYNFEGSTAEVTKHMQDSPRKISKIEVRFQMKPGADAKTREILERTAMTCPVYLSLHPDIEKDVTFVWD